MLKDILSIVNELKQEVAELKQNLKQEITVPTTTTGNNIRPIAIVLPSIRRVELPEDDDRPYSPSMPSYPY